MENWEQAQSIAEGTEKSQERIIQPIEWAERLKEAGWWPIFILHWGNIGGWAAMAWEIYAYLEDEKNPLPKAIIGSSVGSALWLLIRESTKSIKPHNRTNRDIIRHKREMRAAMKWALEKLYLENLPEAAGKQESIIGKTMTWISDIKKWATWKDPSNLKPIYDRFWYEDIYENNWENHFDLIVAYTQVKQEEDMTWKTVLVANNISPEVGDASSAYHGKDPEILDWDTLWKDWNYSDYIKRVWEWIQNNEDIIFFTSYSAQEQKIDTQCTDVIWTWLDKRLCVANEFVDTGLSYLTNVAWAEVTTLRWDIEDEDTRWNLGSAKEIFINARTKARERRWIKKKS